jgi:hypothetical protein
MIEYLTGVGPAFVGTLNLRNAIAKRMTLHTLSQMGRLGVAGKVRSSESERMIRA